MIAECAVPRLKYEVERVAKEVVVGDLAYECHMSVVVGEWRFYN